MKTCIQFGGFFFNSEAIFQSGTISEPNHMDDAIREEFQWDYNIIVGLAFNSGMGL